MKKNSKKKIILFAALALSLGAIGFSFAFGQDIANYLNSFKVAEYKVVATETFTSPSDWSPCGEIPKEFVIKNEGATPVAVRIRYSEYWRNAADTDNLPLEKDNVRLAIINFQNEDDWELNADGYYYYKTTLAAGASTSSLFKSVKLNCEANLGKDNVCSRTDTGSVCVKPNDEYEGAVYHLVITGETIQADAVEYWDPTIMDDIIDQTNENYEIDFRRKAVRSDNPQIANGNGVNTFTERGHTIRYYRGQVDNNNIIWSDICWKFVRTTFTGGIKMIYNGEPTLVDGVRQCLATGTAAQITYNGQNKFKFNSQDSSPADGGYSYGERYVASPVNVRGSGTVFGNDVDYNESTGTYTLLDTFTLSNWSSEYRTIAERYHYTCTSSATTCSTVYYLSYATTSESNAIPLSGIANFQAAKARMDANTHDSNAKTVVEAWFEEKGLSDNDLEDVVYCNDRSYAAGFFSGNVTDTDVFYSEHAYGVGKIYHFPGAYYRNGINVPETGSGSELTLDCANKNDSFTKDDTLNGNGALKHKVGLLSADELTLAGIGWDDRATENYLYTGEFVWAVSIDTFPTIMQGFGWTDWIWGGSSVTALGGLRPVVALKSTAKAISGTGLKTDPFILQ